MTAAKVIDLEDFRWAQFARSRPEATAFHDPSWASLLAACYGFRAFALVGLDDDGAVSAGLPIVEVHKPLRGRRWVSLPFTDACGPLARDSSTLLRFTRALDAARIAAGMNQLEVRAQLTGGVGYSVATAVEHVLDLTEDSDQVFRTFHRSQVQRAIAKASREGVAVREMQRRSDLTEGFYELHVATRRRQGVPVQPRRFFELLWERMLEDGPSFGLLASVGGDPIAAAVFLASNTTTTYKFGASDTRAWRFRPNHLLFWTAIQRSCERGYHRFDFGRTGHANRGLREFKAGWGSSERPLVYSWVGGRPSAGRTRRSDAVAAAVIRRSPSWVCRGVGRALYRHAA